MTQVIDEIDGALGDGKGAVDVIIKMVNIFSYYFLEIVFLKPVLVVCFVLPFSFPFFFCIYF